MSDESVTRQLLGRIEVMACLADQSNNGHDKSMKFCEET